MLIKATKVLTIKALATVRLRSSMCPISKTLAGKVTNNGTITARSGTGGSRSIEGNLTNNGTVTLAGETNSLTGNLTNKGTLALNAPTNVSGSTLTNEKAIKLAEGVQLGVAGAFVEGTGGSIAAPAKATITVSGGVFTQNSEAITGTEVVVGAAGGVNFAGAGACTIKMVTESGSLSGNIAAGQHLILEGTLNNHAIVKASASFTNAGTITLTSIEAARVVALELGANTLTNNGTITAQKGAGGSRSIEGNLVNEKTVSLGAGQTLNVSGSYTQKATGTLKVATAGTSKFGAQAVQVAATL